MEENSIEEALEKLSTGKKIKMYELLRTLKKEGIENFVITRKKYVDVIISDYKRVLKENKLLRKDIEGWKKYCEEIEEEQTEMSNKNCELEFEVEKLQKENEALGYMQGYEQALKDANVNKLFQEGYIYGIQVENKNFIRNLEEVIYELKEKREKGNIVIGYWQIKNMIEEIIKQCKIN